MHAATQKVAETPKNSFFWHFIGTQLALEMRKNHPFSPRLNYRPTVLALMNASISATR